MKPSTERMLIRIKSIYLYIRKSGTVSTRELVEEFSITERTAQRDLSVLEHNDLVVSHERGIWKTTNRKINVS